MINQNTTVRLSTIFSPNQYVPNVSPSMFDLIPHVENHTIEVRCSDGVTRDLTLGDLDRIMQARDGYDTPGQVLAVLHRNNPKGT